MGGIENFEKIFIHSVIPFCNPGGPSPEEEGGIGRDGAILRPWLPSFRCLVKIPMQSSVHLSSSHSNLQLWNPLPPINKVSLPPMEYRDLHPNLTPSMGHLRSNQPDGSSYPLDMFLPIKRRQHQVPYSKRKIVSQLSTKQIYPVTHKVLHGKMKEKLIGELGNPSLAHPSLVMKLQNLFDSILPIRYHHITNSSSLQKAPIVRSSRVSSHAGPDTGRDEPI